MDKKIIKIQESNIQYNDIKNILSNLSDIDIINSDEWPYFLENLPSNQHIFILSYKEKYIGMVSIFIERKIIHRGKSVAHIEDLVILKEYKGMGFGRDLLNFCKKFARENNCYKIILNCNQFIKNFYIKNNFFESGHQLRFNI